MTALNIVGVALIIGGGLGSAYGGFSDTKETTRAQVANIPIRAGPAWRQA